MKREFDSIRSHKEVDLHDFIMNPLFVLFVVSASCFIIEAAVMVVLDRLPEINGWYEVLLDAFLLTLTISPVLYYLLFLPLKQRITEQSMHQHELKAMFQELLHAKDLAEAAALDLAEREEHLRSILENSLDAIIVTDLQGEILGFNPSAERLFGYHREAVVGKKVDELIIPPEYREKHLIALARWSEDPQKSARLSRRTDVVALRADGTKVEIQLSLTLVSSAGKRRLIAFMQDISERNQLVASLHEALTIAEFSSKAKSDFLANTSHEIRTPMNAIIGLTELSLQSESASQRYDYLTKIRSASKALMHILNDILDYAKIEAGKLEMESMDFLLRDVFEHVLDLYKNNNAEKKLELILSVDDTCQLALTGDAMRLQQILFNLLSNAFKFTQEGEIELQVRLQSAQEERVVLQFLVRDTGIGLTPHQMENLFDAFVQVDSSITRKYGGTGLGLAICKQLVNLMGGRIWVESQPGVGSHFYFTAEFKRRPVAIHDQMVIPNSLRNLRVLIVDDNQASRQALQDLLNVFGFVVTVVESGREAISCIRLATEPYQVLLIDWGMSELDGVETVRRVLQSHSHQASLTFRPKIILMTSPFLERNIIIPSARRVGVDAFLDKPIHCARLFDGIMELFGQEECKLVRHLEESDVVDERVAKIVGARILLVEDNALNREVACGVLEKFGVMVEVARHGQEALEMIRQIRYDAVLMDIQMPVMDGVTATQQIRQDPRCQNLPIIAMTANAMEGDKEKYLHVGMNDYMAKPISNKKLYAILAHWIDRRASNTGVVSPLPGGKEGGEGDLPSTLDGFDLAEALEFRFDGDATRYKEFLLIFEKNYADYGERIRTALLQGEMKLASALAHQMKGLAGTLSAKTLAQAALLLEQEIKQGAIATDAECFTHFEKALHQVLASIRSLEAVGMAQRANQVVSEHQWIKDHNKLEALMGELAGLLDKRNTKALACMNDLKAILMGTAWYAQVKPIEDAIHAFDYHVARLHLEKLSKMVVTVQSP